MLGVFTLFSSVFCFRFMAVLYSSHIINTFCHLKVLRMKVQEKSSESFLSEVYLPSELYQQENFRSC